MLLAVPAENLAARIVAEHGTGRLVDPRDVEGFCVAAAALRSDASACEAMAGRARDYAVRNFTIGPIADRFQDVLRQVLPVAT
jgi:glycosyltransferase involved in cell wall biosynthesis